MEIGQLLAHPDFSLAAAPVGYAVLRLARRVGFGVGVFVGEAVGALVLPALREGALVGFLVGVFVGTLVGDFVVGAVVWVGGLVGDAFPDLGALCKGDGMVKSGLPVQHVCEVQSREVGQHAQAQTWLLSGSVKHHWRPSTLVFKEPSRQG